MSDQFVYKVVIKGIDDLPEDVFWIGAENDLHDIYNQFGYDNLVTVTKFALGHNIQLILEPPLVPSTGEIEIGSDLVEGDEASSE